MKSHPFPSEENKEHQPFGKNKHTYRAMWTKPPPEVSCVSYAQIPGGL